MKEVRRVRFRRLEIVVKSCLVRQAADDTVATRFFAEIRNWGDLPLFRTVPTALTAEQALDQAKEYLLNRS